MTDYFLDVSFEVALKEPIGFVEYKELAVIEECIVFFDEIFEPARCADDKLDVLILNFGIVFFHHGSSDEELNHSFGELAYFLGQSLHLKSQLSCGYHYYSLDILGFLVDFVEEGDKEGSSFAGSVLGAGDDAFACDDEGDGLFLDGGGDEVAAFGECQQYFLSEFEFVEIFVFCGLDVLDERLLTLVCCLRS